MYYLEIIGAWAWGVMYTPHHLDVKNILIVHKRATSLRLRRLTLGATYDSYHSRYYHIA